MDNDPETVPGSTVSREVEEVSRGLAAYRLGYNPFAFMSHLEFLWNTPLFIQDPHDTDANAYFAIVQLRQAIKVLVHDITPTVFRALNGLLGGLEQSLSVLTAGDSIKTQSFAGVDYVAGVTPHQAEWERLRQLAEEALPATNPLSSLYALGTEIGRFDRIIEASLDRGQMPSLRELLKTIEFLPAPWRACVPELIRAVELAPQLDKLGVEEFVRQILVEIPSGVRLYGEDSDQLAIGDFVGELNNRIQQRLEGLAATGESVGRGPTETAVVNQTSATSVPDVTRPPAKKPKPAKPVWNTDSRELSYEGTVVKRFRDPKTAKNVNRILDQFHRAKWTKSILNPFKKNNGAYDSRKLTDTLQSLNTNLHKIRFWASSDNIYWGVDETPKEQS